MREPNDRRPQRMDAVDRRLAAGNQLVHRVRHVAAENDESVLRVDHHGLVAGSVCPA
jgi:hypothetical protein